MSEWQAKRFWTEVSIAEGEGGFAILLDGRPVRSPAKTKVAVPTRAMAEAVAAEWEAQEELIDPRQMPVTRTANAALDKVATQREHVIDMLAEYGASDLTCYRADYPDELIARQAAAWDPLIDWAAAQFAAPLVSTSGVMFKAQDPTALANLRAEVARLSNFELAAFHDLVGMSGSLLIGLAAVHRHAPLDDLWRASRIDELWQEEQWGEDEEATALAEYKRAEFLHAGRILELLT